MTRYGFASKKELIRGIVMIGLPIVIIFSIPDIKNMFDPYFRSVSFSNPYLPYFSSIVISILHGLCICLVLQVDRFEARIIQYSVLIIPAFYLAVIILLYFQIPFLYRHIGSLSSPIILIIPYIWKFVAVVYCDYKNKRSGY